MDKMKVMNTLRMKVWKELEDLAEKAEKQDLTQDEYCLVKNLWSTLHKMDEVEANPMGMDMGMEDGYSRRAMRGVYYVDGDYSNGRTMYDHQMDGNSYGYGNFYDPYHEYPKWNDWGHSRAGNPKEDMVNELKAMADKAGDTQVKAAIFEALGKIEGK